MRVLLDYRAALKQRSGVGEYTHQLVRALLAQAIARPSAGLEVTIFSSSARDRLGEDAGLDGAARVDRRIPVSLLNLAWHRLEWPPVEWLAGARFDVVHALHPLMIPARRAARVVTIHDLDFLDHPERTRAEIRRDYPALAARHAARADQVIVVSRFTAADVQRRLHIPDDRLSVCSPGGPDWEPRDHEPDAGYILFVGTLEPRKNVGVLLDAYERLLATRAGLPELVLAGRATAEAQPWLERLARPPLRGLVRHLGYVPDDRRRALYAGACLLVQPSFTEGFGLPVLEAMTVGVPVVAARAGALPEVGGDAVVFAPADDAEATAQAMGQLLDSAAMRADCIARGRRRASTYSWTGTAAATLNAYERAVARSRSGSRA